MFIVALNRLQLESHKNLLLSLLLLLPEEEEGGQHAHVPSSLSIRHRTWTRNGMQSIWMLSYVSQGSPCSPLAGESEPCVQECYFPNVALRDWDTSHRWMLHGPSASRLLTLLRSHRAQG